MGKSTLAKLVARQIGGRWLWTDFKGNQSHQMKEVFKALERCFMGLPGIVNVALDNLDVQPSDLAVVEDYLAGLFYTIRSKQARIVVTSLRAFSSRLAQKLSFSNDATISIPRFSDEEVTDFCTASKCNMNDSTLWAKIIQCHTFGHPQLVHARIASLAKQSWPRPKPEEVVQRPPEVQQELDLARQLLNATSESAKHLLYRLSILTGPFRQDHALAIAAIEPKVRFSGDTFISMVGPWIENAGTKYFRLSPLLNQAGATNWSPAEIKTLRGQFARAIASCKDLTLIEANELLFQGIMAEDGGVLSCLAPSLLSIPFEKRPQAAAYLSWLGLLGRQPGTSIFPSNMHLNFFLRVIQFWIAAEEEDSAIDKLCEIVDSEHVALDTSVQNYTRIIWIMQSLILMNAKVHPKRLVSYWCELRGLLSKELSFQSIAKEIEQNNSRVMPAMKGGFLAQILTFILARNMTCDTLTQFLQTVDELDKGTQEIVVKMLREDAGSLHLAIDRVWLQESSSLQPQWPRVLSCLELFVTYAERWALPELAVFAVRASAVIEDEYLSAPERALERIARNIKEYPSFSAVLEDEQAVILYRQKRWGEALGIWKRILPVWPVGPDLCSLQVLFSWQKAGAAAGQMGFPMLATECFENGRNASIKMGNHLFATSFLADFAFAQWKSGNREQSLSSLATVLEEMEKQGVSNNEFSFHVAWKAIEQVVKWCRVDSGAPSDGGAWEPRFGMCSYHDADKRTQGIPKAPIEGLWWMLAEAEFYSSDAIEVFRRAKKKVSSAECLMFRAMFTRLELSQSFRQLSFQNLVVQCIELTRLLSESSKQIADGKTFVARGEKCPPCPSDPTPCIEDAIVCALVALAAEGKDLTPSVELWDGELGKHSQLAQTRKTLQTVLQADLGTLQKIHYNPHATRFEKHLAVLRFTIDSDIPLQAMVVGHVTLTTELPRSNFRHNVSQYLGKLVRHLWLKRMDASFQFLTPRLTIPKIRSVCEGNVSGFRLAASIVLEGRFAVKLDLPKDVLGNLEALAKTEDGMSERL